MPVALSFPAKNKEIKDIRCATSRTNQYLSKKSLPTYYEEEHSTREKVDRMNFLDYVHPNSAPKGVHSRAPPPNQIHY